MADPYKKKNKEFEKSWKSAAKFGTAAGGGMFAFIWSTFSVLAWVLKAFFLFLAWLGKLLWRGLSCLWEKVKARYLNK